MTNKVLSSLEDTREDHEGLSGGAYTYILKFKNTATGEEKTLFSSDIVGGDNVSAAGEGLHEATDALKDWFYLDTFANGEGGVLSLRVALDGETQGNDYQDTLAELSMQFAVELIKPEEEPEPGGGGTPKEKESVPEEKETEKTVKKTVTKHVTKNKVVKTGDSTNILPLLAAAGISGLVFLLLAIYSLRERRRQKGGES